MVEISLPNQDAWPGSLLRLLERQQCMVEELVQLAHSQASLIAEQRTEGLLDVLARRQALIDEFTAAQAGVSQMTHRLDQRLNDATPEQRFQIKSLIGIIGEKLALVMKTDENDQGALRNARDGVRKELGTLGTGRQARNAYSGPALAGARYADRHG